MRWWRKGKGDLRTYLSKAEQKKPTYMTFLLPDPQEDCGPSLPTIRKVLGRKIY